MLRRGAAIFRARRPLRTVPVLRVASRRASIADFWRTFDRFAPTLDEPDRVAIERAIRARGRGELDHHVLERLMPALVAACAGETERLTRALVILARCVGRREARGRAAAARDDERARIARELHDQLGQNLTAMRLDLGWLAPKVRRLGGDASVTERIRALAGLVDATFGEVRRLGTELRGERFDLGLVDALRARALEFEGRSGLQVDLDVVGCTDGVDRSRAIAILRIFQEALTNVARHADATRVGARLRVDADRVTLEVDDDGVGVPADPEPGSLGLSGMRERAWLLGGTFAIAPGPGGGTELVVTLPLEVNR